MLLSDSRPTQEGLIISSTSTVSFVREVLRAGADYALAGRINQDPLEAYFDNKKEKTTDVIHLRLDHLVITQEYILAKAASQDQMLHCINCNPEFILLLRVLCLANVTLYKLIIQYYAR